MIQKNSLYFSLDEAREELHKRWADIELKKLIEAELGDRFWPKFTDKPYALLWRALLSPDNGFDFFYQCAKYINLEPIGFEFLSDKFVSINDEKKGLSRIKISHDGTKETELVSLPHNEGKKIKDVVIHDGGKLVDFHHSLFRKAKYSFEIIDMSTWLKSFNGPADYYYAYLLHFVAHGVLFETFLNEGDEREDAFTNTIVMPAIERIKEKTGLAPMVVRLYPEHQDEFEDFYWWSYPPHLNKYLLDYVRQNNLKIKPCKF